jgi:quinol monooxygenase YgiN
MISPRRSFLLLLLSFGANTMSAQQTPTGQVYVVTHVDVIPPNGGIATANKLLLEYAAESRKDKGVVRMEVVVQDGRPNHFVIYEVWQSRAAFEAHTATEYAKRFRERIQPVLGSPFDERLHGVLQ